MIDISTYLENPVPTCLHTILKNGEQSIPENIRIHHIDDCDCNGSDKSNRETYFRLIHHLDHLNGEDLSTRTINPEKNIERLATMIDQSYHREGITITS